MLPKFHTKTTFRIKGVRKFVLFASEEERIVSLSLLLVEVQLQEMILHYFSLFCPTKAFNFIFSSSFCH